MPVFDFNVIKHDIEACLNTGNEKLIDGIIFRKAKRFPSGIPSYIRAFEEIGFALFLADKAFGTEQINENTWKELVKPANHDQKILANYVVIKDQLIKNMDGGFKKIQDSAIGNSFKVNLTRTQAIEQVNARLAIYSKLDALRKKFDHSHELTGQITNREYNEKDLEAVCHLLEAECYISYYRTKLGLESYQINLTNDSDDVKLSKIISLPSTKKLKELSQEFGNSGLELRQRGLKFLKTLK